MGSSVPKFKSLKLHELYEYTKVSNFTQDEIRELYIYYQHFSSKQLDDGMISYSEFCEALGLKDSVVTQRIFKIFDENQDGAINFREFLVGLNRFLYETAEQKIKMTYRIFDINQKGYCTKATMAEVLRGYFSIYPHISGVLPKEVVEQIIEQSLKDLDTEDPQEVSYKDYAKWYYKHTAVSRWMAADIESLKRGVARLLASK